MAKYRYPGPKPFTEDDEALFFGREEERSNLITKVKSNKLNIIFGRSGNGKSSLIHASIIPYFKREYYKVIEIRLQPFQDKKGVKNSVRNQVISEFKKNVLYTNLYLKKLVPENRKTSLWQYFKTLQWEANLEGFEGIILIMDQFEELFNFPFEEYRDFARELSEIIYNRTPYLFQEKSSKALAKKIDTEDIHKIDFIKSDFPTGFLIGIRSDRLYLLDELDDLISIIFNNRFCLTHLEDAKIENAVKAPSQLEGKYASSKFEIKNEIIEDIKAHLVKDSAASLHFETFQLQIISQYVEKKAIEIKKNDPKIKEIKIGRSELGKEIPDIISEYYIGIIEEIEKDRNFDEVQKLFVRYLIEKKLIDRKTNSRICLDKTSIQPLGINNLALKKLVDSRIIRKEINTVSGESYEISHDSLIGPILNASKQLGNLDDQLFNYYSKAVNNLPTDLRNFYKRSILKRLLNIEGNLQADALKGVSNNGKSSLTILKNASIIQQSTNKLKETFYTINDVFRDAIIKKQNMYGHTLRKNTLTGLASLFVILLFAVFLLWQAKNETRRDNVVLYLNRHTALFLPNGITNRSLKTDSIKKRIRFLCDIYNDAGADTSHSAYIESILTSFFNSYDFVGKPISEKTLSPVQIKINDMNDVLVIYENVLPKLLTQIGPSRIIYSAYLYTKNGGFISKHDTIIDAAFNDKSELVVLKKDSLIREHIINDKPIQVRYELIKADSLRDVFNLLPIKCIDNITNDKIYFKLPDGPQQTHKPRHKGLRPTITPFIIESPTSGRLPDSIRYKKFAVDYNGNVYGPRKVFVKLKIDSSKLQMIRTSEFTLIPDNSILTLHKQGRSPSGSSITTSFEHPLTKVFVSKKLDRIFAYDGEYLYILDNSLNHLSKYRSADVTKAHDVIAYISNLTSPKVILINLNDPKTESIHTLKAESIIKFINDNNWPSLSAEEEKTEYGYNP